MPDGSTLTGQLQLMLAGQRIIAFYPVFARLGGSVNAGVFLSQLLYWTPRGRETGWVYKTKTEWQDETLLSPKELDRCRDKWRSLGVLSERQGSGTDRTIYYKVNFTALSRRLAEFSITPIGTMEDAEEDTPERGSGDSKTPNGSHLQYAEITTETTAERGSAEPSQKLPRGIGPIIDAFRAKGIDLPYFGEPALQKAAADLLRGGVDPAEIAELYSDVQRGNWGTEFARNALSLKTVAQMIDGYRIWKKRGKPSGKNGGRAVQSGAKGYRDTDTAKYNNWGVAPHGGHADDAADSGANQEAG